MAMMGELFAGFDSMKSLVEKMSETFDKTSDVTSRMVCVFDGTCKQNLCNASAAPRGVRRPQWYISTSIWTCSRWRE